MIKRLSFVLLVGFLLSLIGDGLAQAQILSPILLGAPRTSGGSGPTLDGSATFSNTDTIAPTTTQSNDVIILIVGGGGATNTGTVSDAAGLTWNRRVSIPDNSGSRIIEEWWTIASSPLSSDTITYNEHAGVTVTGMIAFGLKGANTVSPFDSNGAALVNANGSTTTPTVTGLTTSHANDFLIAGMTGSGAGTPSISSPFTLLYGSAASPVVAGGYDVVTSTQSGLTVTGSITGTTSWAMFADSVQ